MKYKYKGFESYIIRDGYEELAIRCLELYKNKGVDNDISYFNKRGFKIFKT